MEWWNRAYAEETGTRQQFFNEAQASLRLDFGLTQHLDEISDSAALQQTNLNSISKFRSGTVPSELLNSKGVCTSIIAPAN